MQVINGEDLAAIITSVSLIITAIGGIFVSIRSKDGSDTGEDRAAAVSSIQATTRSVESLEARVDILFDEISKLRSERTKLSNEVARLRLELEKERGDHRRTRERIEELVSEIAKKDARIKELESEIKIKPQGN